MKPDDKREPANVTEMPIPRARAEEIALAVLAREMIDCEAHEALPASYTGYGLPKPSEPCWWVVCGPGLHNVLDGPPKTLLCVSRTTGRVLGRGSVNSGG
jgi:hypothetical protein